MKKTFILLIVAFAVILSGCLSNSSADKQAEKISEARAIEIIKNQNPELNGYPSDNLPPKSIKTEKTDAGWYVAFIQEGSSVLIIDARCFLVENDNSIMPQEYIPQDNGLTGKFSPKECRLVGNMVGGDRDEHGCIGSAGYSWCREKQKCLRIWEEPCEGDAGDQSCALENCHGLDIKCGPNPPDVCTEMYGLGDKCLKYAKCGILNGKCQQILNPQFTQCKSCVQRCLDANGNDSIKLFECESNCQ